MSRRFEPGAEEGCGVAGAGYARARLAAPLHDHALLPWRFHAGLCAQGGEARRG